MAQSFQAKLLRGSTIAIIPAHAPDSACDRVGAPGPPASTTKQWKSDVHVMSLNPVSARSPLPVTKFKEGEVKEGAEI